MKISITEIEDWQTCRMKWYYKYVMKLRPQPNDAMGPQVSGMAIHKGIEVALLTAKPAQRPSAAVAAAKTFLASYGEDIAGRFGRGVETALGGVILWNLDLPQSEARYEVSYGDFSVVGRPDVWWYDGVGIHVVDFKSTSKDEDDRLYKLQTWNMQPRYYAVLVADWLAQQPHDPAVSYDKIPIYTNHHVLSTRGHHAYGVEQPVHQHLGSLRMALRERAWQVAQDKERAQHIPPNFWGDASVGVHCAWCDFAAIDEMHLTGGDVEDIIRSEYGLKEAS